VFEHRTPGDEASLVVTCDLVNRMKTDLTEEEFKAVVAELAKVFTGGTFDERVPGGNNPRVVGGAGCCEERGTRRRSFRSSLGCSWGSGLLQFTPNSRVVRAVG
jgi:hypothetical protein